MCSRISVFNQVETGKKYTETCSDMREFLISERNNFYICSLFHCVLFPKLAPMVEREVNQNFKGSFQFSMSLLNVGMMFSPNFKLYL